MSQDAAQALPRSPDSGLGLALTARPPSTPHPPLPPPPSAPDTAAPRPAACAPRTRASSCAEAPPSSRAPRARPARSSPSTCRPAPGECSAKIRESLNMKPVDSICIDQYAWADEVCHCLLDLVPGLHHTVASAKGMEMASSGDYFGVAPRDAAGKYLASQAKRW